MEQAVFGQERAAACRAPEPAVPRAAPQLRPSCAVLEFQVNFVWGFKHNLFWYSVVVAMKLMKTDLVAYLMHVRNQSGLMEVCSSVLLLYSSCECIDASEFSDLFQPL